MDYRPFCKASYKNETIYIRQDHLTEINSCANNQNPIERKTEPRTETRTERRTDRTTQRPARESFDQVILYIIKQVINPLI